MKKQFLPFLGAVLAVVCLVAPQAAQASPSYFFADAGSNKLDVTDLASAAVSLNLTVTPFGSTKVKNETTFSFPIIGGAVDAGTFILESVSVGGFLVTDGTNEVTLNSPIVNTTSSQPIMTFLVTVNGNLQGRFAIFTLEVPTTTPGALAAGDKVKISGIAALLSPYAANTLNSTFGTSFAAGQAAASLTVKGVVGGVLP